MVVKFSLFCKRQLSEYRHSHRSLYKMTTGILPISGNFPFHPMNSLAQNLNLRSYNFMVNGSTDRLSSSRGGPTMMNWSEKSRSRKEQSSVSPESMEMGRSSNGHLPVMKLFQKFVTSAGILVECTHCGCKPVFDEEPDSDCQVPDHDLSSLENIMNDILPEAEAVEVVGLYASFLWETEGGHDQ